jgi:hypothetical protein
MAKKRQINSARRGQLAHALLNVGLVLVTAFLVFIGLTPIALLVVLISKWRVFAVQPHHWLVNVRSNSPDLIVQLSFVIFMSQAEDFFAWVLWIGLYMGWLLYLKPKTDPKFVGAQAMLSQFMGLTALFWISDDIFEIFVVLGSWFIAYVSAQHFLNGYDEPLTRVISIIWALFVAELAWVMYRWLIVYPITDNIIIPQISVVTALLGYVVATLYHLKQAGKLNKKLQRRYIALGVVALVTVILISNWTHEL